MNKDQAAIDIYNRVPNYGADDSYFQSELQNAISAVLSDLTDEKQTDLYARILSGIEQGVGTTQSIIQYEVQRTKVYA